MSNYYLCLMGPPNLFLITMTAQFQSIPLSPASLSLLSLLASPSHHGGLARDRLAELLSPGCDPKKSASRLSSAIWRLRQGLGSHSEAILRERSAGNVLSLSANVGTDIKELAEARDALALVQNDKNIDRVEEALNARSGEFLDGCKESWADKVRQICAETYESALELVIAVHRKMGDVDHSISAARTLIREDPYREDIHAVLLELYGHKGLRHRAVTHYAGCCEVLKSDLGVDPGDRLQSSLRAALNSHQPGAPDISDLHAKMLELDRNMRVIAAKMDQLFEANSRDVARLNNLGK